MADKKKKKPQKLKARQPRGFVDRSAADIRATDEMIGKIREVYERYGFDPIETPAFEYTDCLGKFLPDTDRPNAGVFSVQDDDEQWMSLRYDLTAPLARHVAENINEITLPYRTYRNGWVFRNEKPGPGRFRQFMQFDADTVGAPGVQADAEMCMMMADTMEALGIDKGDYVIRVNNRKVLDGVMEAIGIEQYKRTDTLRSLDKFDKFGVEGVYQLLTTGREDESGDFTKGVGLDTQQADELIGIFSVRDGGAQLSFANDGNGNLIPLIFTGEVDELESRRFAEEERERLITDSGMPLSALQTLGYLLALGGGPENVALANAIGELMVLSSIVHKCGYEDNRIKIDPSVVRGLEYYTGPVYEAELLFDVTNEKGEKVQFGSVGGGGRYDGLVKRFTGQDVPATGFSIGVSRLMTALKNLGKLGQEEVLAPVLVTVMDGDTESLGAYQKMVQELRNEGVRAEMYQGNWKKFPNQLRYADKRDCPIAIIQGSDERENGKVQLKDMIEGKRQAAAIESNEEYRAARPGQFEIDAADLVAKVKELLAAQAG